jgi:X-X-X-Leu-X-X-Gly heptad repeat protein
LTVFPVECIWEFLDCREAGLKGELTCRGGFDFCSANSRLFFLYVLYVEQCCGSGTIYSGSGTIYSGSGTIYSGSGTIYSGSRTIYFGSGSYIEEVSDSDPKLDKDRL